VTPLCFVHNPVLIDFQWRVRLWVLGHIIWTFHHSCGGGPLLLLCNIIWVPLVGLKVGYPLIVLAQSSTISLKDYVKCPFRSIWLD
jgi:hypothetical protein